MRVEGRRANASRGWPRPSGLGGGRGMRSSQDLATNCGHQASTPLAPVELSVPPGCSRISHCGGLRRLRKSTMVRSPTWPRRAAHGGPTADQDIPFQLMAVRSQSHARNAQPPLTRAAKYDRTRRSRVKAARSCHGLDWRVTEHCHPNRTPPHVSRFRALARRALIIGEWEPGRKRSGGWISQDIDILTPGDHRATTRAAESLVRALAATTTTRSPAHDRTEIIRRLPRRSVSPSRLPLSSARAVPIDSPLARQAPRRLGTEVAGAAGRRPSGRRASSCRVSRPG
jgi:hypothetical protein